MVETSTKLTFHIEKLQEIGRWRLSWDGKSRYFGKRPTAINIALEAFFKENPEARGDFIITLEAN